MHLYHHLGMRCLAANGPPFPPPRALLPPPPGHLQAPGHGGVLCTQQLASAGQRVLPVSGGHGVCMLLRRACDVLGALEICTLACVPPSRGGCDNCSAAAAGRGVERDLAVEARLLLATVQVGRGAAGWSWPACAATWQHISCSCRALLHSSCLLPPAALPLISPAAAPA